MPTAVVPNYGHLGPAPLEPRDELLPFRKASSAPGQVQRAADGLDELLPAVNEAGYVARIHCVCVGSAQKPRHFSHGLLHLLLVGGIGQGVLGHRQQQGRRLGNGAHRLGLLACDAVPLRYLWQ
eukprot:scaffold21846_cov26-Tisochrysis_lutea.AAC.2